MPKFVLYTVILLICSMLSLIFWLAGDQLVFFTVGESGTVDRLYFNRLCSVSLFLSGFYLIYRDLKKTDLKSDKESRSDEGEPASNKHIFQCLAFWLTSIIIFVAYRLFWSGEFILIFDASLIFGILFFSSFLVAFKFMPHQSIPLWQKMMQATQDKK